MLDERRRCRCGLHYVGGNLCVRLKVQELPKLEVLGWQVVAGGVRLVPCVEFAVLELSDVLRLLVLMVEMRV